MIPMTLPEIAAVEGSKAFHLLVLPGAGSNAAVFNPMEWRYEPQPAKDSYGKGLEPILSAAHPDAFPIWLVCAVCFVAAVTGDAVGYSFGLRVGRRLPGGDVDDVGARGPVVIGGSPNRLARQLRRVVDRPAADAGVQHGARPAPRPEGRPHVALRGDGQRGASRCWSHR